MTDDSLQSKNYIESSSDVDDSYGNKDNVKDAKDVNLDLKNSIKNNLNITIPSNINGVNYANYIVTKSDNIEQDIIPYSNDMTIAEKLNLLLIMKNNIRNHIITNLKNGQTTDFYENGKEKIPFVAYWKMIQPLAPIEKPTSLTLTVSSTKTSWVNGATIKAKLTSSSGVISNAKLSLYVSGQTDPILNGTTDSNGMYTFNISSSWAKSHIAEKTYTVKYDGSYQKYEPCSSSNKITFIKDTPKLTALTSTSIYSGHHAEYKLTDSKNNVLKNMNIALKGNSGTYKDYQTDNNGVASITITKAVTLYYKFNGNSYYNNVAEKKQSFTIKANKKTTKCSGTMTQSPTSRTKPYQIWSKLTSDCTTSNYLRCGHESTGYYDSVTLGGKNGTFHQPAKLIKKDLTLDIPTGATIKSIHIKWSEKQTNGPSASTSKTSFINIKTVTLATSGIISYKKEINTQSGGSTYGGQWVEHNLDLGSNFTTSKKITLTLAYGPNTTTNTGTIYVKGPQVIVEYVPAE